MGAKNILIDFYESEDLRSFAMRHGITIENWQWYQKEYGVKYPENSFFFDFQADQEHVRRIVDNFFDYDRINIEDVNWLEFVNLHLVRHVFVKGGQPDGEEWIDLSKEQVLRNRSKQIYNFFDREIHTKLLDEIMLMITKQKKGVRRCLDCEDLFQPETRGHGQKYCSNACRMRAYRKRKKAERYKKAKKDLTP